MLLYIFILISLLAVLIMRPAEPFSDALSSTSPLRWLFGTKQPYNNICMTTRPLGFPGTDNMNKYWRDRTKNWQIEYSEERVRGDINKVTSYDPTHDSLAPTRAFGVNNRYLENPEKYCTQFPTAYPCPNNWLDNYKNIPNGTNRPSKYPYPGGGFGHIKDKDIDDNY